MATAEMPRLVSASLAGLSVLFALFSWAHGGEQVPLLLWTSEGGVRPPQTPPRAGHIVEAGQLGSYLDAALEAGPPNLLLFLQDKMSLEDFTMYGGAFGNKQDSAFPNLEEALRSCPAPLVLPAVSWTAASSLIGHLQDQLETSPLYMDPETLRQLRLNSSSPALLVFSLPYASGADLMSSREVLRGNDEVIGQVLSIMKSQSVPYSAIYTGLRPAREAGPLSVEAGLGGGRSLLQERGWDRGREREKVYPPVEFTEGGASCILLWARNLSVSIQRGGRWEGHDLTAATFGQGVKPPLHGSACDKFAAKLVLNYENVLGHRSFKLMFVLSQRRYAVSARHWFTLERVDLEYDGTRAVFNGSRSLTAPAEYSYRCAWVSSQRDPALTPRSASDPANQWTLSFQDFQIQGFNVTGGDFSYASDCAGFFSPGIWMGLLTSLLMVLVLTYGLHMIMQLRTMDRFDDPKGPALSVPQTD